MKQKRIIWIPNFQNSNMACKPLWFFTGVQANELGELLNGWGEEGWEVITIHILDEHSGKVNLVAKRLLTREQFAVVPWRKIIKCFT